MAYLDVKKYYLDVHRQFVKMNEQIKYFEEQFKEGNIDEEQVQDIRDNYEILKSNYDRLSYIMYLFDLPKNKKKHKKELDLLKERKYILSHAGRDVVVDENTDVLVAFDVFKKYLEEKKG